MKEFQKRVVAEREELNKKIAALEKFVDGDQFADLPEEEQDRLERQLEAMNEYCDILGARINAFDD